MINDLVIKEDHEYTKHSPNDLYSHFDIKWHPENDKIKDDMPTFNDIVDQLKDNGYDVTWIGSDLLFGAEIENEHKCIIVRTEGRMNFTQTLADLLSFVKIIKDFKVEDVRN